MKQKKLNNKGFSLVELIVVIAIMAVLIGLLAPQFIKYVDRSKFSTDIKNGQEIATVIQTLLADEKITFSTTTAATTTAATTTTNDEVSQKFAAGGSAYDAAKADNLVTEEPKSKSVKDKGFFVVFNKKGNVKVYVGDSAAADYQVYPDLGTKMKEGAGR